MTAPDETTQIQPSKVKSVRLSTEGLVLGKSRASVNVFRCFFAEGKLGDSMHAEPLFRYIVPLPNIFLTLLFSKTRLKRKNFQEIAPLAWAQTAFDTHFDTVAIRWHFPQPDLQH